jgi:hypothetical protein
LKIREDDAEAVSTYLSINGKAVTYDTTITSAITGPIADTVFTDRIASRNTKELTLNFTVAKASGSSPTLAINFLVLDGMEPSNGVTGVPPSPLPPPLVSLVLVGGKNSITSAPTTVHFVISNGHAVIWINGKEKSLGRINVPMLWQVYFQVGGTVPSFSVIGTFEERS